MYIYVITWFKYISCYCLSVCTPSGYHFILYFNTSHVTVYPWYRESPLPECFYFNTSHVTVYRYEKGMIWAKRGFQYISCYCLSKLQRTDRALERYFNTSHVTVYPSAGANTTISCYCLSQETAICIRGITDFNTSHVTVYPIRCADCVQDIEFQYISCYCLSIC